MSCRLHATGTNGFSAIGQEYEPSIPELERCWCLFQALQGSLDEVLLIQHFHILHVLCNRYNCVALTLVFYDIQGTCCVLPGAYCKLISKSHDIAQNGHSLRQYLNKRVATEIRFNANSFSIYATYSATSCQRLSGNCYANIKFCNIFMMVQCIQTALPLLAWFFGENIQRLILFSGVLSQKLYDNYIAF